MKKFHKSSAPQLSLEDASRILEQVFMANQREQSSIPLEVLASYSNYRRERFTLQRTILVIIMVLFLLLPFLFIPSSFTIEKQASEHSIGSTDFNPVYRLEVDSFMLVERVTAVIEGRNVPVYETDSHVYSLEPPVNGRMEVTVVLANRQYQTRYVDVSAVDREAPAATACTRKGNFIYLYLSDSVSGVDYDKVEAVSLTGEKILPDSIDEENGCLTFFGLEDTINVYVPDLAGNQLHLILAL